ncbi:MAG: XrtA/PEP-CTERM system histidine kinase PrsK [Candidatus Binatia bacterium]
MTLAVLLLFSGALICSGLAVAMLLKDPRGFATRSFAAGMVGLAAEAVLNALSIGAEDYAAVVYWQQRRLLAAAILPGVWLLFSLSFARSNYTDFLRAWRGGIVVSFAAPLVPILIEFHTLFVDLPLRDVSSRWALGVGWPGIAFFALFLLGAACVLMNLERTLRAATGTIRWNIKFMVLGVGSLFAVRVYTSSQTLLFATVTTALETINGGALLVASLLIAQALIRLRVIHVDLYLSQTALYHSLTILAIGGYLLVVGLLAKVVKAVGGHWVFPLEALFLFLAFLLLVLFWMSDEWRQRMRLFVSRNFQRPLYDYRKEWLGFTQRTTSLLDSKDLCDAIVKMMSETFGVSCVTIWLLDETKERFLFGGSTVFPFAHARDLKIANQGGESVIRIMRGQYFPVDFDETLDDWAGEFCRTHRECLREAHIRYCVPLVAGRELLGILTLNERVTREALSVEDRDLLKTVADQAAASLLNLQLSRQLLKAKELEAFQTLSTFFIHDLKNLASTLSLTVQNLPLYFDDPDFRDDALRVIANSVQKMNSMCNRLSTLTKGLDLQPESVDLNAIIIATLAELNGAMNLPVSRNFQSLPRLQLDPEQVQKVLVNLLLNANDATGPAGTVTVSTEHRNGWVVMTVQDTGVGMSRDFVERSLFAPFQTTKSQGLGIGLFQSKKIIEAHKGRIEVDSEPGKGTVFRVLFPVMA